MGLVAIGMVAALLSTAPDQSCDAGQESFVLRGRAVDSHGRSLPAAKVHVWDAEAPYWEGRWTSTAKDGTFVATCLPHGRLTLTVFGPRETSRKTPFELPRAKPLLVQTTLPTGIVEGRVLDERGQPTKADVNLSADDALHGQAHGAGATGDHFRFEGLAPGRYRLTASISQGNDSKSLDRLLETTLTVHQGQRSVADLRFPVGLSLSGRVLDGNGNPAPGVTVEATAASTLKRMYFFACGSVTGSQARARTDGEGRFLLEHLADEPFRLTGFLDDRRAEVRVHAGADEIVLKLAPRRPQPEQSEPAGQVHEVARGFAPPNSQVSAVKIGQPWGHGDADPKTGAFEIRGLFPGRYAFVFSETSPGRLIDLPTLEPILLEESNEGVTLRVHVPVPPKGNCCPPHLVLAPGDVPMPRSIEEFFNLQLTSYRERQGRAWRELNHITPGRYTLFVERKHEEEGYQSRPRRLRIYRTTVDVTADDKQAVEVKLPDEMEVVESGEWKQIDPSR